MWELYLWCEENSLCLKTKLSLISGNFIFTFTSLSIYGAAVETKNTFKYLRFWFSYSCTWHGINEIHKGYSFLDLYKMVCL